MNQETDFHYGEVYMFPQDTVQSITGVSPIYFAEHEPVNNLPPDVFHYLCKRLNFKDPYNLKSRQKDLIMTEVTNGVVQIHPYVLRQRFFDLRSAQIIMGDSGSDFDDSVFPVLQMDMQLQLRVDDQVVSLPTHINAPVTYTLFQQTVNLLEDQNMQNIITAVIRNKKGQNWQPPTPTVPDWPVYTISDINFQVQSPKLLDLTGDIGGKNFNNQKCRAWFNPIRVGFTL